MPGGVGGEAVRPLPIPIIFYIPKKKLAKHHNYAYNVLQINTLEAMYEQSIISKSH